MMASFPTRDKVQFAKQLYTYNKRYKYDFICVRKND